MIKLFAHRGFADKNIKQNTIASLKNAVNKGFEAIEFDIWWIDNEFLVKHDKPNNREIFLLPRLRDYLCYGNDLEYWIDFKNLNQFNIDIALEKLKTDLFENKIDLNKVFFAPYITDYKLTEIISSKFRKFFSNKINFVGVCDEKSNTRQIIDLIDLDLIDFVSIDYNLIDDDLLKKIKPNKILAWTVNDVKKVNDLYMLGVDKFATDAIII